MINRKIHPEFKEITKINILEAEQKKLDNNIPVYILKGGTQDIIKLDLIFEAGVWYQQKNLIASLTNSMLNAGTKNFTELQIAEKIDNYGAHINFNVDRDNAEISIFTLKKHFNEVLKIANDIVKYPTFPKKEFTTSINKKKKQFIVDSTKVKIIAGREFTKSIFGETHPYGIMANLSDYDNVTISDLKQFHSNFYTSNNCKIIISGSVDNGEFNQLNSFFGNNWDEKKITTNNIFEINASLQKENIILKPDAVQSALRIGRIMFSRTHTDFIGMQLLNTVFGGYFGSRLMKNIREDKGYTYGIGSAIYSMKNSGYFTIVSEVNSSVCRDAINEIYKEISILQETIISNDELTLVRNYMKGELVKSFDGAFATSDKYKMLIENNLDKSYFDNYLEKLSQISNNDLLNLAQKYLSKESLINVIAGKC